MRSRARASEKPHWNKNALVTYYKRNNQLLARSVDLLSSLSRNTSAARKKIRPFYLGKLPRSGEEKNQPQQPCPTIIPVSVAEKQARTFIYGDLVSPACTGASWRQGTIAGGACVFEYSIINLSGSHIIDYDIHLHILKSSSRFLFWTCISRARY